jgi:hypothetical protein
VNVDRIGASTQSNPIEFVNAPNDKYLGHIFLVLTRVTWVEPEYLRKIYHVFFFNFDKAEY